MEKNEHKTYTKEKKMAQTFKNREMKTPYSDPFKRFYCILSVTIQIYFCQNLFIPLLCYSTRYRWLFDLLSCGLLSCDLSCDLLSCTVVSDQFGCLHFIRCIILLFSSAHANLLPHLHKFVYLIKCSCFMTVHMLLFSGTVHLCN